MRKRGVWSVYKCIQRIQAHRGLAVSTWPPNRVASCWPPQTFFSSLYGLRANCQLSGMREVSGSSFIQVKSRHCAFSTDTMKTSGERIVTGCHDIQESWVSKPENTDIPTLPNLIYK
ncbi:hypothetical protein KGM_206146 [Danaus plexippus plexippus]|uniref:Uncharacterized protein n=1 Tax=Danaus plexippus plexippus TaxID=278856 RepID=A0A212EGL3_DANPL|nr:hypothetical protein KGM_206146 [Danaus plexippus plexippus]